MLCLHRKPNQRLRLSLPDGRAIWITIHDNTTAGRVGLVIDAPDDVVIKREELLPEEQRYNRPQG